MDIEQIKKIHEFYDRYQNIVIEIARKKMDIEFIQESSNNNYYSLRGTANLIIYDGGIDGNHGYQKMSLQMDISPEYFIKELEKQVEILINKALDLIKELNIIDVDIDRDIQNTVAKLKVGR